MALQLFSRGFTFIINQAMLRMAPPRAYGTAAIQFELVLSTILFLSREGVRNALLRITKMDPSARNISILPLVLGFPVALLTSFSYVRVAGSDAKNQDYFTASIGIYVLAALVELMSEPFHNLYDRSLVLFSLTVIFIPKPGLCLSSERIYVSQLKDLES